MYGGVHSKHSAYVQERYEKAKLSPLADLEALGKLEVKAKQFPTASLGNRCVTKMHTKPLSKNWQNDWIQALNEISVQSFTNH